MRFVVVNAIKRVPVGTGHTVLDGSQARTSRANSATDRPAVLAADSIFFLRSASAAAATGLLSSRKSISGSDAARARTQTNTRDEKGQRQLDAEQMRRCKRRRRVAIAHLTL